MATLSLLNGVYEIEFTYDDATLAVTGVRLANGASRDVSMNIGGFVVNLRAGQEINRSIAVRGFSLFDRQEPIRDLNGDQTGTEDIRGLGPCEIRIS